MVDNTVLLRCEDSCCMLVVDKMDYDDDTFYNISVQSSYYKSHSSIWNRIKNAVKILFGKPIYYNDLFVNKQEFLSFYNELDKLMYK